MVPLIALAVFAAPLAAQNYKGKGTEATQKFALGEGLAVFEVQHKGEGDFVVRLLDDGGNVIDDVARGVGNFGGAKAVHIPRTGYYLFNIEAPGEWSVRLREMQPQGTNVPDPASERGLAAGREDAGKPGTFGWMGRGLLGGLLLGPIGTAVAVNRASESADDAAQAAANSLSMNELSYVTAYRQSYADRLRTRRQRSALIGGAVGTSVLVFAIFQAVNLGTSEAGVEEPGPDNPPAILVPLFTWTHR
jgi:hypothetical protein